MEDHAGSVGLIKIELYVFRLKGGGAAFKAPERASYQSNVSSQGNATHGRDEAPR